MAKKIITIGRMIENFVYQKGIEKGNCQVHEQSQEEKPNVLQEEVQGMNERNQKKDQTGKEGEGVSQAVYYRYEKGNEVGEK